MVASGSSGRAAAGGARRARCSAAQHRAGAATAARRWAPCRRGCWVRPRVCIVLYGLQGVSTCAAGSGARRACWPLGLAGRRELPESFAWVVGARRARLRGRSSCVWTFLSPGCLAFDLCLLRGLVWVSWAAHTFCTRQTSTQSQQPAYRRPSAPSGMQSSALRAQRAPGAPGSKPAARVPPLARPRRASAARRSAPRPSAVDPSVSVRTPPASHACAAHRTAPNTPALPPGTHACPHTPAAHAPPTAGAPLRDGRAPPRPARGARRQQLSLRSRYRPTLPCLHATCMPAASLAIARVSQI